MDEIAVLLKDHKSLAGLCAVTFDDGYHDTISAAACLAQTEKWPMTFYLPTRWVDGGRAYWFIRLRDLLEESRSVALQRFGKEWRLDRPKDRRALAKAVTKELARAESSSADKFMDRLEEEAGGPPGIRTRAISWSDVEKASRSDYVKFASHGVSHVDLTALSPAALQEEIITSKKIIEAHVGTPVRHFCYPYGDPNFIDKPARMLIGDTYETGVTLARGCIRPGSDRRLLPRVALYEKDSPAVATAKVAAAFLFG
jgi:peptidoglycan/xylan/chitin deacetylase (PgdA/CDA1 family)